MAGTDVNTGYSSYDTALDRTYYGNGCSNQWGTGGEEGSKKSCTTNITKTSDDEDQKIGTYYDGQASLMSTNVKTDNTVVPDSFCPLGWQLPYSGTGGDYYNKSKSWKYLFTTYQIAFDEGDEPSSLKLISYPLSYIYSGLFAWSTGRLYALDTTGDYWSSNSGIDYLGYDLSITTHRIHTAHLNGKARGFTIRCVTRK